MLPVSPAQFTPTGTLDYHWSPANQRAFLEQVAITGNATFAAQTVSMSKNSAYRLRYRRDGLAFRIGWEAAIMVSRGRLIDDLMERALEGYEETATRSEDGREMTRFKYDTRLAMAMVHRFDRRIDGAVDGRGEAPCASELAFARIVSQDFEAYLDLIEAGGAAAQLSLFLAARSDLASVLLGSHLSQISADIPEAEDVAAPAEEPAQTPQEEAAKMSVWFCEYEQDWRTNFPPPEDFFGTEGCEFGDKGYERTLGDDEAEYYRDRLVAEVAPLREAGEAARRAWFGLEGFTQRCGDAEEDSNKSLAAREPGPMDDLCISPMIESADSDAIAADLCASAQNQTEDAGMDQAGEAEIKRVERLPPEDPNIRVIHCAPQINYAARGMIPPHIARELGIHLPYDEAR